MSSSESVGVRLRELPRSERRRELERFVVAQAKRILQMEPAEPLPTNQSYFELGMTSLGVVDLKERLEASLDCTIDVDVLFNYATIADLVRYLADGPLDRPVARDGAGDH